MPTRDPVPTGLTQAMRPLSPTQTRLWITPWITCGTRRAHCAQRVETCGENQESSPRNVLLTWGFLFHTLWKESCLNLWLRLLPTVVACAQRVRMSSGILPEVPYLLARRNAQNRPKMTSIAGAESTRQTPQRNTAIAAARPSLPTRIAPPAHVHPARSSDSGIAAPNTPQRAGPKPTPAANE